VDLEMQADHTANEDDHDELSAVRECAGAGGT